MYCPALSRAMTLAAMALSLSACGGGDETRLRIDSLSQDVAAQSARITLLEKEVSDLSNERDELAAEVERLKQPPQSAQDAVVVNPNAAELTAPVVAAEPKTEAVPAATEDTAEAAPQMDPAPAHMAPSQETAVSDEPRFAIHLASYRRLDQVREAWPKLLKKYPELLGNLQPRVTKVELEGLGGLYYRLKAGPFNSRDAAGQRCQSFKAIGEYCVVSAFDGMVLDESP